MSIFAIGDLHLSMAPDNEKPMDVFGDRWFNHAERIGKNWQARVTDRDTVVVAGDVSWGLKLEEAAYDLDWIDRLPGCKVILKGNHDLWWSGITRLNSMYDSITFLQNGSFEAEGVYICGSRGWITPDDGDFRTSDEKIYRRELLRLEASLASAPKEAEKIGFLHFPPAAGPGFFSGFMQKFEAFAVKEVYYGHIHGMEGFRNAIQGSFHGINYRLISADYLNCEPLKIR
ncbi:MAG: metallophosphoesterase [Bacillota bacterium]|nr:metallophosphoesterase [Bacillota bacterium]